MFACLMIFCTLAACLFKGGACRCCGMASNNVMNETNTRGLHLWPVVENVLTAASQRGAMVVSAAWL